MRVNVIDLLYTVGNMSVVVEANAEERRGFGNFGKILEASLFFPLYRLEGEENYICGGGEKKVNI